MVHFDSQWSRKISATFTETYANAVDKRFRKVNNWLRELCQRKGCCRIGLSGLQKADQHDDAILDHLANDVMPARLAGAAARMTANDNPSPGRNRCAGVCLDLWLGRESYEHGDG